CRVIAIVLHFFLLSMFSWMLMEGFHLYLQIISVFNTSSKLKLYYIFGWGTPAVITITAAGMRFSSYGKNKICWLSVYDGLIWTFVGPVLFVISINIIVLISVVRITYNKSKFQLTQKRRNELRRVRVASKATFILLPILGITWLFGIISVDDHSVVLSYLFVIFNGLQGFLFFIFHCILNSEVQQSDYINLL
ncbi:uncharacterized protein TRIADDRAFT_23992, partial [Trichoplax adhaerens]